MKTATTLLFLLSSLLSAQSESIPKSLRLLDFRKREKTATRFLRGKEIEINEEDLIDPTAALDADARDSRKGDRLDDRDDARVDVDAERHDGYDDKARDEEARIDAMFDARLDEDEKARLDSPRSGGLLGIPVPSP